MKKNLKSTFFPRRVWEKFLLIMKFKLLLLFLSCIQLAAAEHVRDGELTLKMENVSLEQVIWELQKQTDFIFMYGTKEIEGIQNLSIDVQGKTVNEILTECLKGTDLSFEMTDNAVILKRIQTPPATFTVIKGTVRDGNKDPLPGVTISVMGHNTGVATDVNGNYRLNIPGNQAVILSFSFIGMKTQEIVWLGQEIIDITMEEDIQEVDEVVVTGYQTIRKRNISGSVSTISGDDLPKTGLTTIEQALQGKLPGVVVMNQSGEIGTRQRTRVRGTSTILGSQEPVWVVDGIIQEDPLPFDQVELNTLSAMGNDEIVKNYIGNGISWLNPSDIESITVLKDASATAIYGVKAANGVIVITTKKGEIGRLSLSYSGNYSVGSKITYDKMNLMNSKQRVDVSREIYEKGYPAGGGFSLAPIGFDALLNDYLFNKTSYEEFNAGVKRLETINTDWFDLLYENPFSHNHTVSISGGDQRTTYRVSMGINKTNGTAKGNDSEQYQGSANIGSIFWDKLMINTRISGSVRKTSGFYTVSPYDYASKTSRVIPSHENGELFFYNLLDGYRYNVLHELQHTGNDNTTNSLNSVIDVNYRFGKGFKIESHFGYNYVSSFGESFATQQSYYIAKNFRKYEYGEFKKGDKKYEASILPHGGELNIVESRNENYTWRNQLSFIRNFDKHLVMVMVGQEARSNKYKGLSETLYGYLPGRGKTITNPPARIEDLTGSGTIENPLYAKNIINYKITDRRANYLSFFGTLDYTYDERYVFNTSLRVDASNRFGQDKSARYQPVWAAGVKWNVSREHWLKDQNIISDLSIRATYGYQGNVAENVGPDLIATIPSGSDGISDELGEYILKIRSLPVPDLSWEKNKSINTGIDISLFQNKISGTFEYYYKKSEDIIVYQDLPQESGLPSMPMNGGTMENSGWELQMSFSPVRTKDFVWTLGFNTSKNNNKLTSPLETNRDWRMASSGGLYKKGYPVSAFWAFKFAGLDEKNGAPLYDLEGSDTPEGLKDATVYMKYMGKMDPDFTAGMNTSFRYKTLTLTASFNASFGGKRFLAPIFGREMALPQEYNNLPKDWVNRWKNPGDKTDIPSLPYYQKSYFEVGNSTSESGYNMYNYSDIRVVNASFLRCNNITLAYTVPKQFIASFAQNVGLTFSVTNPFIIVSKEYKGRDPEVATGSQPIARNYTLGINISF